MTSSISYTVATISSITPMMPWFSLSLLKLMPTMFRMLIMISMRCSSCCSHHHKEEKSIHAENVGAALILHSSVSPFIRGWLETIDSHPGIQVIINQSWF
jgi:hypothetical protein